MSSVSERIVELLDTSGLPYERVEHPLVRTARQAAELRGTALEIGGKSLVLKLGKKKDFAVFVVSGSRRLHNWRVRHALGVSRLRFATHDELLALTSLRPGTVPPFGRPIFDLPLYVDEQTAAMPDIAFTLAHAERSAVMRTQDWLSLVKPQVVADFCSVPPISP